MNDPAERPLLADLRAELDALGGELREMAAAAVGTGPAGIAGRSPLGQTIGHRLAGGRRDGADGAAAAGRRVGRGAGRLRRHPPRRLAADLRRRLADVLALAAGYCAWRRFRRRFIGLRETLEELREDLVWLQEKAEGGHRSG